MKLQIIFRPLIVFFGAVAVGLHLALFLIPEDYSNTFLYIRYIFQGEFYHNLIFNIIYFQKSVSSLVISFWNGPDFGLFEVPPHVWTLGYYHFQVLCFWFETILLIMNDFLVCWLIWENSWQFCSYFSLDFLCWWLQWTHLSLNCYQRWEYISKCL